MARGVQIYKERKNIYINKIFFFFQFTNIMYEYVWFQIEYRLAESFEHTWGSVSHDIGLQSNLIVVQFHSAQTKYFTNAIRGQPYLLCKRKYITFLGKHFTLFFLTFCSIFDFLMNFLGKFYKENILCSIFVKMSAFFIPS